MPRVICDFASLSDPGSRGFSIDLAGEALEVLVVRKAEAVYVYQNRCPHTGINLEWQPDRFLDLSQSYIQCATHGALFRIEDGRCLRGPCAGDCLTPVNASLEDGQVILEID